MSVYASLGEEAPAIRDTLVARLCAGSSPRELVLSILDFIAGAIGTQPGLMELFLALRREEGATGEGTEPVSGLTNGRHCSGVSMVTVSPSACCASPTTLSLRAVWCLSWTCWRHSKMAACHQTWPLLHWVSCMPCGRRGRMPHSLPSASGELGVAHVGV